MATLQSGKCFTVPTFFEMCCRSEWQERMYIYKWHEVDQTKHEIFCVHIVCNEIEVKVNLEITTFFFYLRFPYCPNFFWFGVVWFSAVLTKNILKWLQLLPKQHTYVGPTSTRCTKSHRHDVAQGAFANRQYVAATSASDRKCPPANVGTMQL